MPEPLRLQPPVHLDRIRFGARAFLPDDDMANSVDPFILDTYRDEMLARTVVSVVKEVWAQRLEPDVQRVEFTREIPITHTSSTGFSMPATTWDHWKHAHRRNRLVRRLFTPARWVKAIQPSRSTSEVQTITVSEDVVINRTLVYPNPSIALPADRMGAFVYREDRAPTYDEGW